MNCGLVWRRVKAAAEWIIGGRGGCGEEVLRVGLLGFCYCLRLFAQRIFSISRRVCGASSALLTLLQLIGHAVTRKWSRPSDFHAMTEPLMSGDLST